MIRRPVPDQPEAVELRIRPNYHVYLIRTGDENRVERDCDHVRSTPYDKICANNFSIFLKIWKKRAGEIDTKEFFI